MNRLVTLHWRKAHAEPMEHLDLLEKMDCIVFVDFMMVLANFVAETMDFVVEPAVFRYLMAFDRFVADCHSNGKCVMLNGDRVHIPHFHCHFLLI